MLLFLNIGGGEMVLIILAALLMFGGKKLPELARGLGRGLREFKDASESIKRDINDQINNFGKELDAPVNPPAKKAADEAPKTTEEDYSEGGKRQPDYQGNINLNKDASGETGPVGQDAEEVPNDTVQKS